MMDGWIREDPPTMKKLPVESDVPELLVTRGQRPEATEKERAIGDWSLIAYYYLLRIGEYTGKELRASTKRTKQFKLADSGFYGRCKRGRIRRIAPTASDDEIMAATGATLKLDNQKNGWKGVCVHHEANGDLVNCPVKALARRYVHVRRHVAGKKGWTTFLSAVFEDGIRQDITDKDIRDGLKWAAECLDYPGRLGIPVDRIDTHSLRMGGANALALAGYSDTQIQKMGRWRGATFKEYIHEELACYSEGMSANMKRKFGFVNVAAGAFVDITDTLVVTDYTSGAAVA